MGLKYICKYKGLNQAPNRGWEINIYIPDYDGMPIEKYGVSEQACIIEWDGGDKLYEKFTIGSKAAITLLFDDPEEVDELQLVDDKTCKVVVYEQEDEDNRVIFWQGYLISDGIQSASGGVSFPVTLTAVDMLEASESIDFIDIDCGAVTVSGQIGSEKSPINWIRKCLISADNINNNIAIRWSCETKNLEYPTDDFLGGRTSLIYNFEELLSSRQDIKVGWLLENILKSVGCVLYQFGGFWNIVSIKSFYENTTLSTWSIGIRGEAINLLPATATASIISPRTPLPTQLNESLFRTVQKPISNVKATYNHSMPSNIIPNGGFDILDDDEIIYWSGTPLVEITPNPPINNRNNGKSAFLKNNGSLDDGYITFWIDDIQSIPIDANVLFKTMQWGFLFMPENFPEDVDGFIDWSSKPLEIIMSYVGYRENIMYNFFLNEFGYWEARNTDGSGGLSVDAAEIVSGNEKARITLSGEAFSGSSFKVEWKLSTEEVGLPPEVEASYTVEFITNMSLADAATKIADDTGGTVDLSDIGDGIAYVEYDVDDLATPGYYLFSTFFAAMVVPFTSEPRMSFTVEGLKNGDVASVQFQSKGNQGNVLFPNPGVLDQMRALESGKLSMKIVVKPLQEVTFDDLYMNVPDNKEYWQISNGGTNGSGEYSLDISSSFSGFMTTSYMDNFTKSDLSMIMTNGVDTGTLTEIFGKTALRLLSKPTKRIDVEVEGIGFQLNIYQYLSRLFMPLKMALNTENNSSKLTIFELQYDTDLTLTSQHKSTENG